MLTYGVLDGLGRRNWIEGKNSGLFFWSWFA